MKDSFILYNSFYEPIKALKNEQLGKLLRSIFNYTINGEITQDSEILVAFMFIKNQIDIDTKKWEDTKEKRSEAGRIGGIKRALNNNQELSSKSKQCLNKLSKVKQNQANQAVNDNVNVNVNVNNKYIVEQIIDYLNEKCNTKYKSTTNKTKILINARLNEGFNLDDLKKVVDIKTSEWLNTKMEQYLRPETLFGTKFESYLNQKQKESYEEMMTRLRKEFENE